MARSVVAYYESVYSAKKAVQELAEQGFSQELVTILVSSENGKPMLISMAEAGREIESEIFMEETGAGMRAGIGIGGALGISGSLLFSLGIFYHPIVDPLLAQEPLMMILSLISSTGLLAAAGGALGGMLGSLIGLGIPGQEVHQYAKNVRQGKVLISLLADRDEIDQASEILGRHYPLEVKEETISHNLINVSALWVGRNAIPIKRREQEDPR